MQQNEKQKLCEKYIWVIAQFYKCNKDSTYVWNERRIEIHESLIDAFECDPVKMQTIFASLDVWIAFPCSGDELHDQKISELGKHLYDILMSDFFKKSDSGDIREMHKKLSQLYFDDENFKGWTESITNSQLAN